MLCRKIKTNTNTTESEYVRWDHFFLITVPTIGFEFVYNSSEK